MIHHIEISINDSERRAIIRAMIENGKIRYGGNKKLRIYGTLSCTSGKRMKLKNRVFFETEEEAIELGYRPCGYCMRDAYLVWKKNQHVPAVDTSIILSRKEHKGAKNREKSQ